MGADGGSIPRRDELVKQKQRAVRHDPALLATLVWFYCALSKEPLREPIVACALGRMYNRESILQHLLDPTRFGDMAQSVSHITSLRDVIGLQLSPYRADQNTTDGGAGGGEKVGALVGAAPDAQRPQFACPLSGAAMNGLGGRRFVAVRPCGCVVAERAFLDLVVTGTTKAAANADAADTAAACCPVCATPMVKSPMTPVVVLNPPAEEVPEMVARDRAEKAARKADRKKAKTKGSETEDGSAKKQRKRSRAKATEADGEQDQAAGEDDADQPPAAKRAHVDLPPAATAGINLSLPSVPVPKPASAAIASLYAKKTDPRASSTTDNSNFFVRGTYSRGNG
ncbi:Rtf2 RING-finger-domain-containing protein [Blastocladiella britannica]|nr:Rtf2 RING-finger-domain-containing protein [Blastocladiella britannica]